MSPSPVRTQHHCTFDDALTFQGSHLAAVYASDLKRATQTAQALHVSHSTAHTIPFFRSPILREQCFGSSEGTPWISPFTNSESIGLTFAERRAKRFPGQEGESLQDVELRARWFVAKVILPWLLKAQSESRPTTNGHHPPSTPSSSATNNVIHPIHLVVVAHGIFLSEFLRVLMLCHRPEVEPPRMAGFANTGWSRLEVTLRDYEDLGSVGAKNGNLFATTEQTGTGQNVWPHPPAAFPARFTNTCIPFGYPPSLPSPLPALPATALSDSDEDVLYVPRLDVEVVHLNNSHHLAGLKRQKGGIGSAAYSPEQKKLEAFFGGGGGGTA